MSFTGDLSQLGQLARNLERLASLPSAMAPKAAEAIEGQIRSDFAAERSPYARSWARLEASTIARKRGDDRILRRTDAMLDGLTVRPQGGAGIVIEIADYGGFHLNGTINMVARPMLPVGTFPASWRKALEAVRDAMAAELMAS